MRHASALAHTQIDESDGGKVQNTRSRLRLKHEF